MHSGGDNRSIDRLNSCSASSDLAGFPVWGVFLIKTQLQTVTSCFSSDTQVNVTAGGDATLDCQAHIDGSIKQIAWSKTDLESDEYVFFSGNHSLEVYQLPSVRGRVELLDPEMKQGDASVVLKNVTADDSGIYECVVSTSSRGRRRKRAAPFRHKVHLKVEDSGEFIDSDQRFVFYTDADS